VGEEVSYKGSPVDAILEMSVLSVGVVAERPDVTPPLRFVMTAGARLIDAETNSVLDKGLFSFTSRPRPYTEWAADQAQLFREALAAAYKSLAEQAVEELLLIYPLRERIKVSSLFSSGYPRIVGLIPLYSDLLNSDLFLWGMFGGADPYMDQANLNTLRPELRWEPFPAEENVTQEFSDERRRAHLLFPDEVVWGDSGAEGWAALKGRVAGVTYELKIWEAQYDVPGALVYARAAIPTPFHKVEEPLKASTDYLWSVRAHFLLDGHPRVSEWAMVIRRPQQTDPRQVPPDRNPNLFRIRTPSEYKGESRLGSFWLNATSLQLISAYSSQSSSFAQSLASVGLSESE
jgi:hypothetical protein